MTLKQIFGISCFALMLFLMSLGAYIVFEFLLDWSLMGSGW